MDNIYIAYYLIKELLKKIIAVALIVLTVWIVISYTEILIKNVHINPHYSRYNLFTMYMDEE